ncbi:MAG: PHP domain-containing protein, partial [Betaproteobacteria bacterium]|nr:PHP domain-containing protein [Betaproteobacteria bacterium]
MTEHAVFSDIAAYAELHCISNFSFLHGASHPEELVERAAALGYSALALTDECSLAGIVRAHVAAKAQGLHLICGSRIDFDDDDGSPDRLQLLLLATDRDGYAQLSELITAARMRAGKGCYRALLADLEGRSSGLQHLAGLPGCLAILVPPRSATSDTLLRQARWLQAWFGGRAWVAHQRLLYAEEDLLLERLLHVSQATGLPLVACGDVVMHVRSRKPLHDTLQAIRLGTPVADCGYALMRNAEQHLRSRLRIAQLYPPQHLRETLAIASRCRFSLDELRYEYPDEIVPPGHTPAQWLRELTQRGAQRRYPAGAPQKVLAQIEHELRLIAEQRYEPFFLTVHDVVSFARSQGILCQGRGSAANSVVCYCLGITEVDPAEMDVLFERFISKERNEPPDIDVDFEHQRREEVIQYLYRKYGRDRTALAATVVSYRPRSALRDVGKALGIDLQRIEQVA